MTAAAYLHACCCCCCYANGLGIGQTQTGWAKRKRVPAEMAVARREVILSDSMLDNSVLENDDVLKLSVAGGKIFVLCGLPGG